MSAAASTGGALRQGRHEDDPGPGLPTLLAVPLAHDAHGMFLNLDHNTAI